MSLSVAIILVVIAFLGGIGITTIGPGGIFVTITLFVLAATLGIDHSTVAGTASATFIVTGLIGSIAYLRSGQLASSSAVKAAALLSVASVVGSFSGAQLNTVLDARTFGILLGLFVLLTGGIILQRRLRGLKPVRELKLEGWKAGALMVLVGVVVGLPGGLLGVGGPVLAVPLMVLLGVPMLLAVALAQVQSIFISGFATAGYAIHSAVDWMLALLVGVPLVAGTVAGWWIARRTDPERLKVFLGVVLLAVGIYLLVGGAIPA